MESFNSVIDILIALVITKHPMYPLLTDADKGNKFEVGV